MPMFNILLTENQYGYCTDNFKITHSHASITEYNQQF